MACTSIAQHYDQTIPPEAVLGILIAAATNDGFARTAADFWQSRAE